MAVRQVPAVTFTIQSVSDARGSRDPRPPAVTAIARRWATRQVAPPPPAPPPPPPSSSPSAHRLSRTQPHIQWCIPGVTTAPLTWHYTEAHPQWPRLTSTKLCVQGLSGGWGRPAGQVSPVWGVPRVAPTRSSSPRLHGKGPCGVGAKWADRYTPC